MTYKEAYIAAFNVMDINKEFTTKQIIDRVEKIKSDGTTPQPSDFCYNITNKQYRNVYAAHLHLFVQKENGTYTYLGQNVLYQGVVTNKIQETGETVIVGEWIDGVYRERKSAWLLTWNPENWEWKDNVTETTWSCRSKGVQVGDTVYVIKVGEMPRGIMASGIATSEPIEEPHWDEDKRNSGRTTRSINVKFNTILNVEMDSYLDQSLLKNLFPDQDWSPMGSGISIKEEYVNQLAKEWEKVVNQKGITKKYSVFDSVWIAAALMSYEKYKTIDNPNVIDMFLKQSHIRNRAQQLTDDNVDSARISWWCCADAEKHVYNYLREVKDNSQTPCRRLTGTNEMNGEKECPQDLNDSDILETSLGQITMSKLKNFVDNEYTDLVNNANNLNIDLLIKEDCVMDKNIILYGPPGTGKTYNTTIYAVAICDGRSLQEVESMGYEAVKERYNELMEKENRIAFTTFHQSYGYEEFIEGIRPVMEDDVDAGGLQYKIVPGVFKAFCENAKEEKIQAPSYTKSSITVEKNEKPYVFIIDEINRGNISKIFGELITLIEETKRLGEEEAMTAILPYSGSAHPFEIPNNVYILGTMNTADRSIALMDTALRRRFNFIEMMPKDELLQDIVIENNGRKVNVQKMLKAINDRIEFLFDREHMIGHAFFWGLRKDPSLKRLSNIFKKSVVPLLQEYFYDDYEKIQLVLGDTGKSDARFKFILNEEVSPNKIFRGRTNLEKEQKYRIQESAFDFIESYEGILNSEE